MATTLSHYGAAAVSTRGRPPARKSLLLTGEIVLRAVGEIILICLLNFNSVRSVVLSVAWGVPL